MSNWNEYLIAEVIGLGVLLAIWRGGQANPLSTGQISRRLGRLENAQVAQDEKINQLDEDLKQVKATMATGDALEALQDTIDKKFEVIRAEAQGDRALAQRTWNAIDRIQNYFVEFGIGRKG